MTRTAELEDEVSVSRAELVRISGELHARRGTDVVDAERAFGEELQRVQESATREARSLKQEANGLRASLEQTRAKLQKSCGERWENKNRGRYISTGIFMTSGRTDDRDGSFFETSRILFRP